MKDEVTISKSQKDKADDLNREAYLRVSGENYLNIIYKIKNTDEIDKLEKKYEDLTHEENDEEYRIRQAISDVYKRQGGDCLLVSDQKLEYIISKLRDCLLYTSRCV